MGIGKPVLVSGLTISGGDAGNYTLTQPTLTADITTASSATALVSSENPSLQGSNVTFTATVTPVAPATTTPTGSVRFYTNGIAYGGPRPLSGGVASITLADLPIGYTTVVAVYLADGNFYNSVDGLDQLVHATPETPVTVGIKTTATGR